VTIQSPTMNGAMRAHGTRFEVTLPLSASAGHDSVVAGAAT
jgi:hypothetical protein